MVVGEEDALLDPSVAAAVRASGDDVYGSLVIKPNSGSLEQKNLPRLDLAPSECLDDSKVELPTKSVQSDLQSKSRDE